MLLHISGKIHSCWYLHPHPVQLLCRSPIARLSSTFPTVPAMAMPPSATRPKLLILGTGWGATSLLRAMRKPERFDITVASERDHMLFTPLLASTATGALEHRSIIEPIRPLATRQGAKFINATATAIESMRDRVWFEPPTFSFAMPQARSRSPAVQNSDVYAGAQSEAEGNAGANVTTAIRGDVGASPHTEAWSGSAFHRDYDALVVAVGATVNTFSIPGVREHTIFMKEAAHARAVRKRMHDLFEASSLPLLSDAERRALLTFVVVGAGPTGVELCAELADWLSDVDSSRRYRSGLAQLSSVVLVEASGNILSLFDHGLREYALRRLRAAHIDVRLGARVREVARDAVVLAASAPGEGADADERLPCGMVVWTAGIAPRPVIATSDLPLDARHAHVQTDGFLLCGSDGTVGEKPVFAIGDCATIVDAPLVPIAQVAEQQGAYVARLLDTAVEPTADALRAAAGGAEFAFASKGMLAYVGARRGVASVVTRTEDDAHGREVRTVRASGWTAWLVWRFAYLSKLGSLRNKLQVPLDWLKTALFGRDVSSF